MELKGPVEQLGLFSLNLSEGLRHLILEDR